MAEDGMYLDNLDEFVNDENKVVTYKWLSRTLHVHVNTAKQMLFAFVEKSKKDVNVTYLVAGITRDHEERVHTVQIVSEDKLDSVKNSLESVTSCHIYSIQKAKLKDTNALYIADHDMTKNNILQSNEYSAITCPIAKPRSEDELRRLKVKAQPTKEAPNFAKPTSGKTTQPKKKADIGSMFANQKKSPVKQDAKQDSKQEPKQEKEAKSDAKTTNSKPKANEKPAKAKQGGLSTFFANQAARPKKEKPAEKTPAEEKESNEEKQKSPEKEAPKKNTAEKKTEKKEKEVPKKNTAEKKTEKKEKEVPKKKAAEKKNEKQGSRRKNTSRHDEGTEKKRRRIQNRVWSDSSDDEEEEQEMEVAEQPPSPPSPEVIDAETIESEDEKPAAVEVETDSKRRKRTKKLVSKTYVNDEGYMVTEKVMESASETDQSDAEDKKAPLTKAPPTKPTISPTKDKSDTKAKKKSPVKPKTKQGNIMSFFKKK